MAIQLPPEQDWLVPHTVPHPPQWFESVSSSMQASLHKVSPMAQAQIPLRQTFPVGHTIPHPPQFFESVCGSTQVLVHTFPSLGQVQAPLSQLPPIGHFPLLPQLFAFVWSPTESPQATAENASTTTRPRSLIGLTLQ
jgi:hypothetical protein